MKLKKWIYLIITLIILSSAGIWTFKNYNFNSSFYIGQPIDSLNHVYVYFNGGVENVVERNTTTDGYNLGLKYQCVEFVKRYYYEHFNHKMPDSYGHAVDFFNPSIIDGDKNIQRNLFQFSNPSFSLPKINDILIFSGTIFNKYGHVAIVSDISENKIEIIQQNPGQYGKSRECFTIEKINGKWKIKNNRILGWLSKNK